MLRHPSGSISREVIVNLSYSFNSPIFVHLFSFSFSAILRINKKGSQKDMEQKKAGAYFFYDQDDVDDIDDDDL